MSENKQSSKQRRFPWKVREPRRWGSPVHFVGPGPRKVNAYFARSLDGIGAFASLLFGCITLGLGNSEPGLLMVGIVFVVIGLILSGIAIYAHLSCREEEKIKAEEQALRDEKQRLWREKRRAERNAKKKK